jgi:hypothetical protein
VNTINIQLPESLDRAARELAMRDNVSLEQFIILAVAEKISALLTEGYLAQRAARATRAKFDAAMAQVPDVEPPDAD